MRALLFLVALALVAPSALASASVELGPTPVPHAPQLSCIAERTTDGPWDCYTHGLVKNARYLSIRLSADLPKETMVWANVTDAEGHLFLSLECGGRLGTPISCVGWGSESVTGEYQLTMTLRGTAPVEVAVATFDDVSVADPMGVLEGTLV